MRPPGAGWWGRLGVGGLVLLVGIASAPSLGAAGEREIRADRSRPRVGVALGGGGARGLAHIGVLQWFEEHRIPIDCLAGTSMGGLVGGATAVGLSPDSLRTLVCLADWDRLFSASASYEHLAYRRKEDARLYPVRFEVGLRWGPKLPSGLNPGPHVTLLLSSIALPQSDVDSFDDFPIPFRCVATDLATGSAVVLDHGSLPVALRATMAIPGVFEPVWIEGRLLADGGMVDNVPVDVVRGLGADVVVAVDVYAAPVDSVPETLVGVLQRALEIPVQLNVQPQLARADVVLHVDPHATRTTDYQHGDSVVATGYRAAAAHAAELLPLALDPGAWEAHLAARRPSPGREPEVPRFVTVEGVPRSEDRRIAAGLQGHVGVPLDQAALERDLDRVVGTGRYASAGYEWARSDAGRGLRIRVREKPYGPPTLRFGIEVDNEHEDLALTVCARATFVDLTSWGSEARVDAAVGASPQFALEFFQPLWGDGAIRRSGLFLAPRGFVRRDREDDYEGQERIASTHRRRAGAGADAGLMVATRAQLRAGYETSVVDEDVWSGSPPGPEADGQEQVARVEFTYEGQDAATIPRRGAFLSAEARWYVETPQATAAFGQGSGRFGIAVPSRSHDRTSFVLEGATPFGGGEPPLPYRPTLGGLLRLGAFQADELRGRHVALVRLTHLVAVARLGGLSGDRVFVAGVAEYGSAFDDPQRARGAVSGSLGLVTDTAIGPCALLASLGSEARWRIHFTAGKSFR